MFKKYRLFILFLLSFCFCIEVEAKEFVKTDGHRFVTAISLAGKSQNNPTQKLTHPKYERKIDKQVQGETFYFNGANQYYLFYATNEMIDEVFADAKDLGLNVMRVFGFCDGMWREGYSFHPEAFIFDEATFQKMDYIIYKAKQCGIRLIIPLVNNWDDFGGMNQYVKWAQEYGQGGENHDDFYTNSFCRSIYKVYLAYFLNRENTYTGVRYKDDPTIMIWELANEPRCESDASGNTLFNWVEEMASYIKFWDDNHLVATGEEGFYKTYGADFLRNSQSQYIDVCTFHLYPESESYNMTEDEALNWIEEHTVYAHNTIGKPIYLGEFGIQVDRSAKNGLSGSETIHTFSSTTEGWIRAGWMASNAFTANPVRSSSFSYDGNGSIYYDAYFNGTYEQEGGGEINYAPPYKDFSNYSAIKARVYISITNFQADIYMQDKNWAWENGTHTNLTSGGWREITISLDDPSLDYSQVQTLGIRVTNKGTFTYDGFVYIDSIEGVIDNESQMQKRNRIYSDWYNLLDTNDADGAVFWLLSGHTYADYDNYTVYSPEDTETCSVIQGFSDVVESKSKKIIVDRD